MPCLRLHRGIALTLASSLSVVAAADSIISYRCETWSEPGSNPHAFAVVQFDRTWSQSEAATLASLLGARLAVLPSPAAVANAEALSMPERFWQCAGPWVGASRGQDQSWAWIDARAVDPVAWANGRPAQPVGLTACALLAGDGAPSGGLFDALDSDLAPARTSSAIFEWDGSVDCDGDGAPDALEIATHPELDLDFDGMLDACSRPTDLDRNGSVDFADVALALLEFGDCPGCPSDLDENGVVDYGDVAFILLDFS